MAENFGSFFSDVEGGEGERCKPHRGQPVGAECGAKKFKTNSGT